MRLDPNTVLQRNQSLIAVKVDDELVMMDGDQGVYISLNPIGAVVWENLENPIRYEALIQLLLEKYDVTLEACERDVEIFLKRLNDAKLLKLKN